MLNLMDADKVLGWVIMLTVFAIIAVGLVSMVMGDFPVGGSGWATHCGGAC